MPSRKKRSTQTSAAAMISAGVLFASGAGAQAPVTRPAPAAAMEATVKRPFHIKWAGRYIKYNESLSVIGMSGNNPLFESAKGEYFQVDPATGDLKFLTAESLGYIKMPPSARQTGKAAAAHMDYIKLSGAKMLQHVSVAGVDDQGHVIQTNARGQQFYLTASGDMVFVK